MNTNKYERLIIAHRNHKKRRTVGGETSSDLTIEDGRGLYDRDGVLSLSCKKGSIDQDDEILYREDDDDTFNNNSDEPLQEQEDGDTSNANSDGPSQQEDGDTFNNSSDESLHDVDKKDEADNALLEP